MDGPKTVIVRHLPVVLEAKDQEDLLRHFGAEYVHAMGSSGRMKNVAFATFASYEEAERAVRRLHQLEVLGSRLVVEYSSSKYSKYHATQLPPVKKVARAEETSEKQADKTRVPEEYETEEDRKQDVRNKIHSISGKWGVDYPLDPRLMYAYPAPTLTILTNIANAMAAVPRFYVQVLHLMNKMNLPAPFGLPTLTPPLPLGVQPPQLPNIPAPPLPEEDMEFSSSAESELESDGDNSNMKKSMTEAGKRARKRDRRYASRKRLRLQIQMQSQMQSITTVIPPRHSVMQQPGEIFEQPQQPGVGVKKIEFKKIADEQPKSGTSHTDVMQQSSSIDADTTNEVGSAMATLSHVVIEGGFGKIQPKVVEAEQDDVEPDEDWISQGFISVHALQSGRLSETEMKSLDAFKNYDPGEPTTRLYIKNLAKKISEKELRFIFGRYVNWNDEMEKSMFYVQLLTGRMKGQAFITLPNESAAKDALSETNGFQLQGKAMVVQFARSVKPKDGK